MSCMHNVYVVLDQVPVLLTLGNIGQCSLLNVLTLLLSSHLMSVSLLQKKTCKLQTCIDSYAPSQELLIWPPVLWMVIATLLLH